MIEQGARIKVMEVEGWYDCGKPETLLSTNAHLLRTGRAREPEEPGDSRIEGPVRIEPGVELSASMIGPDVSIADGARIRRSRLSNCIVGRDAVIEECDLADSLVGSSAHLSGLSGRVLVGDDSSVEADRS